MARKPRFGVRDARVGRRSGGPAIAALAKAATTSVVCVVAVTVVAATTAHATTTFYVPGTAPTPQKSGPIKLASIGPELTYFASDAFQIGYPASLAPFEGAIALDPSVAQGVAALDVAIREVPVGEPIQLIGVSQGDVVLSVEERALMANPPANTDITFIRVADPTSPTGIMGRNAGLALPGMTFVGAPEAPFNTVVITRQYDGIADWPAQQLNVLADVNAVLGAVYLHDQSNYAVGLDSLPAGSVTTTTNSFGATKTTYLIPYPGLLPILRPFQELGVDERLLDTIQVPLKRVIDSAYTTPSWGRARTVAAAAGQKALKAVVNTVSHVVSAIAPSAEKPNGVLAAESSPGPLVPDRSSSRHDSSAKLIPRKRFPGPSRKRSEVDPEPNSARTGPRPNILALRTQLRHSVDAQSHGVTKAAGSGTGRHGRHRSGDASNGPA